MKAYQICSIPGFSDGFLLKIAVRQQGEDNQWLEMGQYPVQVKRSITEEK
jgi:hypothetical protein